MKVVKALEMAKAEALAYQDGISDEMYMLNAASGIAKILLELINNKVIEDKVIVLAGSGNNAGDGYVVAKILLEKGYDVKVYQLLDISKASRLCKLQYNNFIEKKGKVIHINKIEDLVLDDKCFVLDAIFGTGFKKQLKDFLMQVVIKINLSNLKVVSIDIPSGLNGDDGKANPVAIKADITIYLGLAKLGFFINDGPNYIGDLKYVDFGLEEKYKKKAKKELEYMDNINLKALLPKIDRKRHKYQAGFVIGIAGSLGMFGAAKLASLAALKAGCGIVKLITDKEVPSTFYELVNFVIDYNETTQILNQVNKADATFIGSGLGRDKKTEKLISKILPKITIKTIIDADALFHLSNNEYTLLPHESILTPHKKEMLRLLRLDNLADEALLKKTQKYSQEKNVIIVLKGYPTIIFHPEKDPLTILGGDPGLASAGTGDVLTGMITSFAAQKLDLYDAAILAVNMHFKAAELAADEKSSYCLMASDVVDFLPKVFKSLL